jgi:hypothetical protein|tara:strand:- start:705 stop:1196 length:492 start_codon:yes stop_codon:yes gene_type:complete
MNRLGEGAGDPFDTPIPGQSLTDTPGNYPWEHPPKFTNTSEAAEHLWERMTQPEFAEQIIAMLDAGVPVEAIGRVILLGGFVKGTFNPDVAFIIAEPLMKMITTIGMVAEVPNLNISMDDIGNKNEIRSAVQVKATAEKIGKEIKEEIKQKGIMAKPNKEESK